MSEIERPSEIQVGGTDDIQPRGSEASAPVKDGGGPVALTSLAPRYDEPQHAGYLRRLTKAVEDPKNRNIALSGRYGTGKSSVLNKFQEEHTGSTLRIAVSTLAPDAEGVTLTNRIQKEVLKQLVYSAEPRTLRHSRFTRQGPLSWWRALGEAALVVAVLGVLLALLGWLPSHVASGSDSVVEQTTVWVVVAVLLTGLLAGLRRITYDRFVVSDVSAAGATLSLSAPNNTYFDEHLDEIVYFFDQEPVDFVIFEDLDRYNDPQIFQALRELNTLLNNTPRRLKKIKKAKEPLRFIYAMRDSLFEKIGEDTAKDGDDAARAETVRANRTKFFEVVIPVVPFISHRTARELLHQLIQEAGVTGIERPLVELVAKHATDMRLLLNMRNEYLVFAERLLGSDKVAPELSPSHLFALVAYKNFHLEDFEDISRRSSDLDRLYDYHRELVATSVEDRERRRRALLAQNARPPAIGPFAYRLGRRLVVIGKLVRDQKGWANWHLRFTVDSDAYDPDEVTTPAFWEAVVSARTIAVQATPNPGTGGGNQVVTLAQDDLEALFPEALKGSWEERNAEAVREELAQLDHEIEVLRGADFHDLVAADKFRLTIPVSSEDVADGEAAEGEGAAGTQGVTFGELVDRTLQSAMARDLVTHGYIDRNFTLYAAQFYGDFTGVDVATFIVQTVQTNSMDINYQFAGPGAIANLLAETDEGFTRSISAYNVQVVDYLLVHDVERADEVVKHLTSNFGSEAEQFLAAFFTSNGRRTRLAERLSQKPWRDVFTYLATNEGVPTDVRTALVDAALLAAAPDVTYDLGSDVGDFVVAHYKEMPAFTEPHPRSELDAVVTMLRRAEALLPSLDGVHEELRPFIVENDLYELTAENLRTALDITGEVTLDQVRANDSIYRYCLANLNAYLDAVEADQDTDYSVRTPQRLVDALEATHGDDGALERLAATAAPDSSLRQVTDAPESTWPTLAAAQLFRASLVNLEAYRAKLEDIDENLGKLLLSAGVIHVDGGDTEELQDEESAETDEHDAAAPDKSAAAIAVLNARRGIPSPEDRVKLVRSIGLDAPLAATQITPEQGGLFALLLEHELVPDNAETFAHLREAGWAAVGPALVASRDIEQFLSPDLVDGMVADLFGTPKARNKVGQQVLKDLAEYLPTDNDEALTAAARFAVHNQTALPVDQIRRVATTCKHADLTVQLLWVAAPEASDIVAVLNELGGKYSYLTTWEQGEFEVPYDDAHRAVFKKVADANLCRATKKKSKNLFVIKKP